MNVSARLSAFAAGLVLAFGGAVLVGSAIDPTETKGSAADDRHGGGESASTGHGAGEPAASGADGHGARDGHGGGAAAATRASASGLAVTDGPYGFDVDRRFFRAGERAAFTFRITDRRGAAVRDEFEVAHDRKLHLIVVRRDIATFVHLHPRRGADGTWSVDLGLREPGVYRAYADFTVNGRQRTVATDLFVPGHFTPRPLPAPRATDQTGPLDVTLARPGLRAGREARLSFAVTRGGQPFERLEPYLGAKGHLVALREGDLAYLHVHPVEGGSGHAHDGAAGGGAHASAIGFATTFPTAGRYRLFLQFKTAGEVRTVAHTLEVPR